MNEEPRRVIVMGAGPAGLSAAYELSRHGVNATVLEQDPKLVGGLARTAEYHGYRFDIGGHRFFSKNQEVERLWTEILGEEMLERDRLSRILYRGRFFDYPLKPLNALRNLGLWETLRCVGSYARARLRPIVPAVSLEDWVTNQFGRRLFEIFFKTYTEKVWGMSTTEISADWAAQRIRGLDLWKVARAAFSRHPSSDGSGEVITTLIDRFRYPRLGPGQLWQRVREMVIASGGEVRLDHEVTRLDHENGRMTAVWAHGECLAGDQFISTLPIRDLVGRLNPAPPDPVLAAANGLGYRDFLTVALILNRAEVFPDNWMYVHDPDVKVGRLQNFKNWSPDMVPDATRTCIGMEYFCFEGDGLWSSSDEALVVLATAELESLGLCRSDEVVDGAVVRMAKAYPVYDDTYQARVATVRDWLRENASNLHLAGRNGMHKYNNQDHSMVTGLFAARNIALRAGLDPWRVNADAEYLEEGGLEPREGGREVPARLSSQSQ